MRRARLPVWTLRWNGGFGRWELVHHMGIVTTARTRREVLESLPGHWRASGLEAVSVRVRNKSGRHSFERTYPRSADPRRSRG